MPLPSLPWPAPPPDLFAKQRAAVELIERTGSAQERFGHDFCEACRLLLAEETLPIGLLARLLRYLADHDCYYHAELCDLKTAALKQAADLLPHVR